MPEGDKHELGTTDLVRQADAAAAGGDLRRTEEFLTKALQSAPPDLSILLKLAGVQRALGRPSDALASVDRALSVDPRDFTALLMRASLLQRQADADVSGEAWVHALAQGPEGQPPSHLVQVIKEAELRAGEWEQRRSARMSAAIAETITTANAEEAKRIERFRTNALRLTRPFHSEPTHFHFPGLRELEFHPRQCFPWLERLESETEAIAAELNAVMAAERAELVPYVQYEDHVPLEQWRALNRNPDWTAIHLLRGGQEIEVNTRHCPQTVALLRTIAQPVIPGASPNAMFSLLAPNTAIPPHVGINNARLVCHLPLIVPDGCWFRVGAQTRDWHPGEAFVFDDTIEHEALNPTNDLRVVLIFDVWHPDLAPVECMAVAQVISADTARAALL